MPKGQKKASAVSPMLLFDITSPYFPTHSFCDDFSVLNPDNFLCMCGCIRVMRNNNDCFPPPNSIEIRLTPQTNRDSAYDNTRN